MPESKEVKTASLTREQSEVWNPESKDRFKNAELHVVTKINMIKGTRS